jgi:uridine monophosphate synthetase
MSTVIDKIVSAIKQEATGQEASQVNNTDTLKSLVLALHEINAICFGDFKLKSGIQSPIYIDLRLIISYPNILQWISELMHGLVAANQYNLVCGVPYTALPIATLLSSKHNIPMVMRRKEVKSYGLKKAIEGVYKAGQNCLIIEDLVTSGLSVFETIEPLEAEGIKVNDIVVLIDREQGGKQNIQQKGKNLYSVLTISHIMDILLKEQRITEEIASSVRRFISQNQVSLQQINKDDAKSTASTANTIVPALSFEERAKLCRNGAAKKLCQIIANKKSNLCVSADVTSAQELLRIAEETGPYICMLKTHIDIISHFSPELIEKLKELAVKFNFLIFEDRKFADIGSTVQAQFSAGIYSISSWSDITNCHIIPGAAIIEGLKAGIKGEKNSGLLLIAEMSSEGNLAIGDYTKKNVELAENEKYKDFVCGFICQHKISNDPALLHITPG